MDTVSPTRSFVSPAKNSPIPSLGESNEKFKITSQLCFTFPFVSHAHLFCWSVWSIPVHLIIKTCCCTLTKLMHSMASSIFASPLQSFCPIDNLECIYYFPPAENHSSPHSDSEQKHPPCRFNRARLSFLQTLDSHNRQKQSSSLIVHIRLSNGDF